MKLVTSKGATPVTPAAVKKAAEALDTGKKAATASSKFKNKKRASKSKATSKASDPPPQNEIYVATMTITERGNGSGPKVLGLFETKEDAIDACQKAARNEPDMQEENETDPTFFDKLFKNGPPYEHDDQDEFITTIDCFGPHTVTPASKKARTK